MKLEGRPIIITYKSILAVSLILLLIFLAWAIKGVIVMLFVAMILALALEPAVDWFVERKLSRGAAVMTVVLLFTAFLVTLASVAITPLVRQVQNLFSALPLYIENIGNVQGLESYVDQINSALIDGVKGNSGNILNATIGAFNNILSTLVVLVFTTYLLIDFNNIRDSFVKLFPKSKRKEIQNIVTMVEFKLGGWLRGQVILMIIVGVLTYIGLLLLRVPYPLALAVIAGLLEVIPIIGPIISVVPAALVALGVSWPVSVGVIGLYLLVQQAESSFIVPKVMQKAVGFNPLVTIVALMVGGSLLGLVGAILAIPFAIVLIEIAKYLLDLEK